MLNRKILRQIDIKVDSDDFLKEAKAIAYIAVKNKMNDNQIRNLQNIINSTTRFSEINNYVKAQTGRHKKNWGRIGPAIIENLEKFNDYSQEIYSQVEKESSKIISQDPKGEIRLQLCRHWIKIVVAEFLYGKSKGRKNEFTTG